LASGVKFKKIEIWLEKMVDEKIFELIKKPKLFLTEKEAKALKEQSVWREEPWIILNEMGNRLRLYSKTGTIAITNFFRDYDKECSGETKRETIFNYLKKIYELENERELYTRIIKDYYFVIKLYVEALEKKEGRIKLPKVKSNYRLIPLKERKKIEGYPFLMEITKEKLRNRAIDRYIIDNLEKIKKIRNEEVIKWVEYMMLWSTFDGWQAEKKTMEFLRKRIPEIKWRWSTEEEDIKGADIIGEIDKKEIWIQVKLVTGARMAFGDIDFEKTIMLYIKNDGGKFYLVPKDYCEMGLPISFIKMYCDIRGIDFIKYLKNREKKFNL